MVTSQHSKLVHPQEVLRKWLVLAPICLWCLLSCHHTMFSFICYFCTNNHQCFHPAVTTRRKDWLSNETLGGCTRTSHLQKLLLETSMTSRIFHKQFGAKYSGIPSEISTNGPQVHFSPFSQSWCFAFSVKSTHSMWMKEFLSGYLFQETLCRNALLFFYKTGTGESLAGPRGKSVTHSNCNQYHELIVVILQEWELDVFL